MVKTAPAKVHIIGSVGSGKTTLAKELSTKLEIPYYELDNVVWMRKENGDSRRTEEEREKLLHRIVQTDKWIIEGVHHDEWVKNSFQQADTIIFLDTNYYIRTYRIMKRFIKQKVGIEKAHYQPSFKIFFKMFQWNKHFEEVGKPDFFKKYQEYQGKVFVVKSKKVAYQKFFRKGY
ncbi:MULTISPECIES: AAA family ATPase [unclassified Bacillus (in: firmicutes)]|uniref:AAA family ATPase n=1 Tax=Bacillaceae TaxID=186817 RepID=UPI0004E19A6F|nr:MULTISPECIES: AAA family ATPase [unclassified Bacillus (in: firmicutes)]